MFEIIPTLLPREERRHGFVYFKDHASFPCVAGGNQWHQAWWCAQLSLLTYTNNPVDIANSLEAGGLTNCTPDRPASQPQGEPAQLLCAHDGRGNLFIAFRGTDVVAPADFSAGQAWAHFNAASRDVLTDLKARKMKWPDERMPAGAEVHEGFLAQHLGLRKQVEQALKTPHTALWLTGHSLGGSLALLAALDCLEVTRVISFGAPAVGNAALVSGLKNVPHTRLVNGMDGIARLPPEMLGYVHQCAATPLAPVDIRALVAAIGIIVPAPPKPPSFAGGFGDFIAPLVQGIARATSEVEDTLLDFSERLLHHSPVLYVAQCHARL